MKALSKLPVILCLFLMVPLGTRAQTWTGTNIGGATPAGSFTHPTSDSFVIYGNGHYWWTGWTEYFYTVTTPKTDNFAMIVRLVDIDTNGVRYGVGGLHVRGQLSNGGASIGMATDAGNGSYRYITNNITTAGPSFGYFPNCYQKIVREGKKFYLYTSTNTLTLPATWENSFSQTITDMPDNVYAGLLTMGFNDGRNASPHATYANFSITDPPIWAATYPSAGTIAQATAAFLAKTDVAGIAYFVVLTNGATAPTSAQVRAGTDASDAAVAAGFSGSTALTANTEAGFSASNLTPGTDYDVYLVAQENSGPVIQWAPVKLDITTSAATVPSGTVLVSPADTATGVPVNLTLIWNKTPTATSYEFQISTVSDFSSFIKDSASVTDTFFTISGLAYNTPFYWRVNATNSLGTGAWSTTRGFTTAIAAPAAPSLVTPSDMVTNAATTQTLIWNLTSTATGYRVQVSTDSTFATTYKDSAGITDTTYALSGLTNNTRYYWHLAAVNAGGSTWSTMRRFTTIIAAPASAPILLSPTNNALGTPINPILIWNKSSDATTYQVQVSTVSNLSSGIISDSALISDTTFLLDNLFPSTIYYWHVKASNSGGTTAYSTPYSFTTMRDTTTPINNSKLFLSTANTSLVDTVKWQTPESPSLDADSVFIMYRTGSRPVGINDPASTRMGGFPVTRGGATAVSAPRLVPGLAANIKYYFALFVADSAKNVSLPVIDSIIRDTLPPVTSTALALSTSDGVVTVKWSTPAAPTAADAREIYILHSKTHAPLSMSDTAGVTITGPYAYIPSAGQDSASVSGLQLFTKHYFSFIVADSSNNYSAPVKDSIVTILSGDRPNPVKVDATYLDQTHVGLRFTNFAGFTYSPLDSIGLWYRTGTFTANPPPHTPPPGTTLEKFWLYRLRASGDLTTFDTTVTVDSLPFGGDSVYYFSTSMIWHLPDSISPFVTSGTNQPNGDTLLMRDTIKPVNSLSISGRYLGGDSARITLASLSTLTTSVDSVIVWHGPALPPDFTGATATNRFSALDTSAMAGITIKDALYAGKLDTVFCSVVLKGKNRLLSAVHKDTSFTVGLPLPNNIISTLTATPLNASQIRLRWNDVVEIADSIRILYSTTAAILLDYQNFGNVQSHTLAGSDTAYTVMGLAEKTQYYFGLQIKKGALWSYVTAASSASAITPEATSSTVSNTIKLERLFIDSTTNSLHVIWHIADTAGLGSLPLDVGITYGFNSYSLSEPSAAQPAAPVTQIKDTTQIALREAMLFDTTYYVSLWLRPSSGQWTSPTDSSRDSLRSPSFTKQTVTYFERGKDSIFVNNKKMILWKDPSYPPDLLITDTIVLKTVSVPGGFISLSQGYEFISGDPFGFVHVGVVFDTSLGSNVRLYRDSLGVLLLCDSVTVDTVAGIVSTRTKNLDYPFIALIDTVIPSITALTDTASIVSAGQLVYDTLNLVDNIGNLQYTFYSAKGNEGLKIMRSDHAHSTQEKVTLQLPQQFINDDYGIRAIVVISDGVHTQTINLSRSVRRTIAEVYSTFGGKHWTPVHTSALLDSVSFENQFLGLSKTAGAFTYDKTRMRAFRWYPYDGNFTQTDKWMEYTDTTKSIFSVSAGSLFWIKTDSSYTFNFGSGVTVSLKGNYNSLTVKAKNWCDFGLPFRFGIKLSDIVSTMGPVADSLQWYAWADSATSFTARPLYIADFAGSVGQVNDDTLFGENLKAYTVYNPLSADVTLLIPPTPVALSRGAYLPKASGTNGSWCIQVLGRDEEGTPLSPVYCGFSKAGKGKERFYQSPHSFGKAALQVSDAHWQGAFGHVLQSSSTDNVNVFNVILKDVSDQGVGVSYRLEGISSLPQGYVVMVLDGVSGALLASVASQGESLTLNKGESKRRVVVIGPMGAVEQYTRAYISTLRAFMLLSPNPNNGRLNIRYRLGLTQDVSLRCRIYTMAGRLLLENQLDASQESFIWNITNKNMSPGIYVLTLNAYDVQGKTVKAMKSKFTFLP